MTIHRGVHVPDIALLLQAEGYDPFKANQLARKIAEYERNVAYQRERFLNSLSGITPDPVLPSATQALKNADRHLRRAANQMIKQLRGTGA